MKFLFTPAKVYEEVFYSWTLISLKVGFFVFAIIHLLAAIIPDQQVLKGHISPNIIYIIRMLAIVPIGIWYIVFKKFPQRKKTLIIINPFILHFFTALPAFCFSKTDPIYYHFALMQGIVGMSFFFFSPWLQNALCVILFTLIYMFININNVAFQQIIPGISFYSFLSITANWIINYFMKSEYIARQKIVSLIESLKAQEKSASLGMLTSGIGHELRNPVTFIRIAALSLKDFFFSMLDIERKINTLINKRPDLEQVEEVQQIKAIKQESGIDIHREKIGRSFDDIIKNANISLDIIKSMSMFSRKTDKTPVEKNMKEMIDNAIMLLKPSFNTITIKNEVSSDFESICYGNELGRALVNIIMNACEAVKQSETPLIIIDGQQDETHWIITVKDNGQGISAPDKKKIFEPFYITKPVGEKSGQGLGLAIVENIIVDLHQGRIEVKDNIPHGAIFELYLPKERLRHLKGT